MSIYKEGAATGKHQLDGPPRLNSRRCGTQYTPANGLNQSLSDLPSIVTKKPEGARMNQEIAIKREQDFAIIDQVVMQGDLSKLNSEQRVMYYNKVCESLGLNPNTNPFSYISLNGKLTLYAKKDCTEQLRKIHGVSIEELDDKLIDDIYVVTAKAKDKYGRVDQAKGAVVVGNLRGEAKANAIMKAETKAKRRVTLSICGMAWTDETEIETIPNAKTVDIDMKTGEIKSVSVCPQPPCIENKPRLTQNQMSELMMILDECEEKYKSWVYEYVKKAFKSDDLSGVPAEMYDRMKSAAIKNMEQNYEKICAHTVVDPQLATVEAS